MYIALAIIIAIFATVFFIMRQPKFGKLGNRQITKMDHFKTKVLHLF